MNLFTYVAVDKPEQAIAERGESNNVAYLAGGTNLIDDMKLGVESHDRLVDVNALPFNAIDDLPNGGLRIGATVRNTELAYDPRVIAQYPGLSQAILAGASPQLRNAATTAGNLLQRTRCYYFRDGISPCNKREPGGGCSAIGGYNRIHAILGTSEQCIATHPSDMDVAMTAFEATIIVQGKSGERRIPIGEFYVPYGFDPAKENTLAPGELITAVELPATAWFAKSHYLKARDRSSYEFALSSALVAVDMNGKTIRDLRIALGGVATKPWRATEAEGALRGQQATPEAFAAAADAELKAAVPQKFNAFKIELCKRVIVQALSTVTA